jgi:hypothetical protein
MPIRLVIVIPHPVCPSISQVVTDNSILFLAETTNNALFLGDAPTLKHGIYAVCTVATLGLEEYLATLTTMNCDVRLLHGILNVVLSSLTAWDDPHLFDICTQHHDLRVNVRFRFH